MVYVALAEAIALVLVVFLLVGLLRSQQRAHARREDLLLNQMLHLAGKPWTPAPADERGETPEFVPRRWTPSPEQEPLVS